MNTTTRSRLFLFVALSLAGAIATASPSDRGVRKLCFVENRGQWPAAVKFRAPLKNADVFIVHQGMICDFHKSPTSGHGSTASVGNVSGNGVTGDAVQFSWHTKDAPRGRDLLSGHENFLFGAKASNWITGARRFESVESSLATKGVLVRYYIDRGCPRYDLVVAPHADASRASMTISGACGVSLQNPHCLRIRTSIGTFEQRDLSAYQVIDGIKKKVDCHFAVDGNEVRFMPGRYDRNRTLIIDPLVFSTFLGGALHEIANATAIDPTGGIVVVGETYSSDFPTTLGAYQRTNSVVANNQGTAFVSKFSPDGSRLVYSTYIGGSGSNGSGSGTKCAGVQVDALGRAVVTGSTISSSFPTTAGAFQTAFAGLQSAYITKLSADGSALIFSTFIGASGRCEAHGVVLDSAGNVVVAGEARSSDFPTTNGAYQRILASSNATNAFVAKLATDGAHLLACTYLGGSIYDQANAIAIDQAGTIYVGGITYSQDFPTSQTAFQTINKAGKVGTAFVSKLSSDLTSLSYSSYFGGSGVPTTLGDEVYGIAVDNAQQVTIAGGTSSSDLPVSLKAFQVASRGADRNPGYADGFVARLSTTSSSLVFSTYLSGSANEVVKSVALDPWNNPVVTGYTASNDFPVTPSAFQFSNRDYITGFINKISADGSTMLYGTYFGGSSNVSDFPEAITVDSAGDVFVAGSTGAADFPTTAGAYQTQRSVNSDDAFLSELSISGLSNLSVSPTEISADTTSVGQVSLSTPAAQGGAVVALSSSDSNVANVPTSVTIPTGAFTATFNVVGGNPSSDTAVTIISAYQGNTVQSKLVVDSRKVKSLKLQQLLLVGGNQQLGTVTLNIAAPSGGANIALASNDVHVLVPSSISIPSGQSNASFLVTTTGVAAPTNTLITAQYGTSSTSATLQLLQATSMSLQAPTTFTSGNRFYGFFLLNGQSAGGDVSLSSSDPSLTTPASVHLGAGVYKGAFLVTTSGVAAAKAVTITGTYRGSSKTATVNLLPADLSLIQFQSGTIKGGTTAVLQLYLSGQSLGGTVAFTSSDPALSVPATANIPADGYSLSYRFNTSVVASNKTVTVTAQYEGVITSAIITLTP